MTGDLDAFARLIEGKGLQLRIPEGAVAPTRRPGKADALFHLPLLALAILLIAKLETLTTEQVGRRVAQLLIEHFKDLHDVTTLEWSITLRRRCAEALTFLEMAKLIDVNGVGMRQISPSQSGKQILARGLRDKSDLGLLARGLARANARAAMRWGDR